MDAFTPVEHEDQGRETEPEHVRLVRDEEEGHAEVTHQVQDEVCCHVQKHRQAVQALRHAEEI